jgi:hypothetical protein
MASVDGLVKRAKRTLMQIRRNALKNMNMSQARRRSCLALAVAGVVAALAQPAGADVPVYDRITIDAASPGAAFVVAGNVADNPRPEIVVSSFGQIAFGPSGPIYPAAGTVTMYKNAQPGNAPNGQLAAWNTTQIVGLADGITFPNRPLLADVSSDGKADVIVPGGFFWDAAFGNARGSLTWWQNSANGKTWIRHDLITNSAAVYHSAVFDDFDGDAIEDIMTVAEAPGLPSSITDDVIGLQLLRGNGDGTFQPPVQVAVGGGSLILAYDVNNDGNLDIVSPQYFGPVLAQPFVPLAARNASNASFVWFENDGNGNFTRWAIGVNQGPGFCIVPVPNLLGDGVTRWIASNHTNKNITSPPFSMYPAPAVFEFTPGADPRALWSVRQLSAVGDFPVTGGQGQAAPGAVAAGHLNDDGRLDIAVSGDGSRAVYWMEQQEDGSFVTQQLPNSTGYGQAGGPVIIDLNRNDINEVIFSSFDQNAVSIWTR